MLSYNVVCESYKLLNEEINVEIFKVSLYCNSIFYRLCYEH